MFSSSSKFFFSVFTPKSHKHYYRSYFFLLHIRYFYFWFRFRPHKETSNDKNTTKESDRDKIIRILTEFGLEPSDYIFNSSKEQPSDHSPSSPTQISISRLQSSITSGRPLSYVQKPPPPPPIINRQSSKSQLPNDMTQQGTSSRRTPPPPPLPDYNSNKNDPNSSVEHYLRQVDSQDIPPVKVIKPNSQNVVYRKEIRIRYLQPPTPPPPAPIIIREKHVPPNPPESVRKKNFHFFFLSTITLFFSS
jgi:hypothetical protein